jgi:hypothetical protein
MGGTRNVLRKTDSRAPQKTANQQDDINQESTRPRKTEYPWIYTAPRMNEPGLYRGAEFVESSAQLENHPLTAGQPYRIAKVSLPTFLMRFIRFLGGSDTQDVNYDHISQPAHRHTIPRRSALRKPGSEPRTPRSITFAESVEGYGVSQPRSPEEYLGPEELALTDERAKAYDDLWFLLQDVFLNRARFVEHLTGRMPRCLHHFACKDAIRAWANLAKREKYLGHGRGERHVALCMMGEAFKELQQCVFSDLHTEWNPSRDEDVMDKAARELAKRLVRFFVPFEYIPFGPDHACFVDGLCELSVAAYQLRALLSPTEEYKFHFYMPLQKYGSEHRLRLIQNRVRVHETIGAHRRPPGRYESRDDVAHMVLCGGLIRRGKNIPGPGGSRPRRWAVCERKAVCVAYRPRQGEKPENKFLKDGETERSRLQKERRWALELAEEVQRL